MKSIRGTHFIEQEHPELLKDESSLAGGNCQSAAWPADRNEASNYLKECSEDSVPVTISGARTGVSGGAVPMNGAVLSTELLKGIRLLPENGFIRASAGETLDSVLHFCRENCSSFFYPPDPTETTASIGGTIATDASGASSYLYGSTRKWINRLEVILPSGTCLEIVRGKHYFRKGKLKHPSLGALALPFLETPQPPKNAAGLFIDSEMDLIDLFIGSEGRLGVITEADLVLHRKPYAVVSFAVFCNENQFWNLRDDLMKTNLRVRELEAMIEPCLSFLSTNTGRIFPKDGKWVLLTSFEVESEEELDTILEALDLLLEENGISPESTWGGFDGAEITRLREFRHLLPETINRIISSIALTEPGIHKISTDTAVPPHLLRDYYTTMSSILQASGVEHVVFGHSGQGHLHANLIPKDMLQLKKAEHAVELIAMKAVKLGGTVSAEHGTGKLKKSLLGLMYSSAELSQMEALIQLVAGC